MKKLPFLVLFLYYSTFCFAQKHYTVKEVPNPKIAGQDYFVSNPDGILGNVDTLNRLITQIEKQTKIEIAVVAVKNFEENKDDFEFAKALFEEWGVGKAGADNGLLLLIAVDRRQYRFITGTGIEGLLPDVTLKKIGDHILVPAFKEARYEDGVLAALLSIQSRLLNPTNDAEIQQLAAATTKKENNWTYPLLYSALLILLFFGVAKIIGKQSVKGQKYSKASQNGYDSVYIKGCGCLFFFVFISIFVMVFTGSFGLFKNIGIADIPIILYVILAVSLFFRYFSAIANLRRAHNDDENFFDEVKAFHRKNWWLVIFSPIILVAMVIHSFKRAQTTERFKPIVDSKNQEMQRLDRDENIEGKPFLSKGQREEEIIKAYDYDIWQSADHSEHIIKAWPAEAYNSFTECPKCNFRTYSLNKQETIKAATYSAEGQAKLINECSNCKHVEFIKWVTLAMLVQSSSSSSSSSGGSSSSSSSSGSFGGGSSSGGGAGGSW
ncbi:TPM domain-containing protein [Pedobacter sp. UC225_65]|uniref:TPM domain-containing protein n=1 Tax=Pedobacter sp. UC225_65 TaxID=3350173 RepID=UPI00366FF82B